MSALLDDWCPSCDPAGLTFRALDAGDEATVRAVFDGMSAHSRRMRFLSSMPRLTGAMRRRLSEVDGTRRVALVAAVDGVAVGIGRYVRDADDPSVAEFAVEVVDAHQGRGVGAALLDEVTAHASASGVRRLVFSVHAENDRMRALLRRRAAVMCRVDGLYEGVLLLDDTSSTTARSTRSRSTTSGRW